MASGDMSPGKSSNRDVLVGRNSQLWRELSCIPGLSERFRCTLGHAEVASFGFLPGDRVWIFSYSRRAEDNTALLQHIAAQNVAEIIYLASSSAIVGTVTSCYSYPYVKHLAEQECLRLPQGKILVIGQIYRSEGELPPGISAATSLDELAGFMLSPRWGSARGSRLELFRMIERGFARAGERHLFAAYDWLLDAAGRFPCLLRPVDLLLRLGGCRWYGYVRLSNKLRTRA